VDYLVIGHGCAGLFSATLLANMGKRVAVAGCGETATSLSTGCIGVLTHRNALSETISSHYPYSMSSGEPPETVLSKIFDFLLPRLDEHGLSMHGHYLKNFNYLTCLGTAHTTSFTQEFGIPECEGEVALLGLMGYPVLDPDLALRVMIERNSPARPASYWIRPECFGHRINLGCQEVSYLIETGDLLEELCEAIADIPEEIVGIPPLADLRRYSNTMERLNKKGGRRVLEVITPAELPGKRLNEAMTSMCSGAGVKMLLSHTVISMDIEGKEAISARLRTGSREFSVSFSGLLLAPGDVVGGGIEVRKRDLVDRFSLFRISSFSRDNLKSVALSGIASEGLHPITKDGEILDNVVLAGSCLPGFSYADGVGMGGVLFTAWLAARELGGH